jgi:hypothetical protein
MNSMRLILPLSLLCLASASRAQWFSTYNDPTNGNDLAKFVATDPSGNVYVTGASDDASSRKAVVTEKYTPAGILLWTRSYKYYSSGGDDIPGGIAVDSNGNCYVAATAGTSPSSAYVEFLKYDTDGTLVWHISWNLGHQLAKPVGYGVDAGGNPYWLANGQPDGGTPTFYLYKQIKDNMGYAYWGKTYNFGNIGDTATALKVAPDGTTYVAAVAPDVNKVNRALIMKHDTSGNLLWKYFYKPAGGEANVNAVDFDSSGNVYFAGNQVVNGQEDVFTGKLDKSGAQKWLKVYDDPNHLTQDANAISVGPGGNVFVAGFTSTLDSFFNMLVLRYDTNGGGPIVSSYDNGVQRDDVAVSILADAGNRVYVLGHGYSDAQSTHQDMVRLIYSGTNLSLLNNTSVGAGAFDNVGAQIISDGNGHVQWAGSNKAGGNGWDYYTRREVFSPGTVADAYYVNYGHALVTTVANGVLANDVYVGGGSLELDAVPASGTLAIDTTTGTFTYTPSSLFFGADVFKYHAKRENMNGNSVAVKLTVVPALASVTASPASVKGGVANSTGTVNMNHVAGAVLPKVTLTSSNPAAASVPATVTVPLNASKSNFVVTSHAVAATKNVTITAKWNGTTKTTVVTVTP